MKNWQMYLIISHIYIAGSFVAHHLPYFIFLAFSIIFIILAVIYGMTEKEE